MTDLGRPRPTSTYRVQLSPDWGFAAAEQLLDYLQDLGVSHLYLSPVLEATPGSTHGYDVIEHGRVRAEFGGEGGLRRLSNVAAERGIGIIVDVVPNHMAVPVPEYLNPALWSVLRDGPDSPFANWFDVTVATGQQMLMPILGSRIDEVLDAGDVRLDLTGGPNGESVLRYFDHVLPVRAGTESLPVDEMLASQYYRLAYWQLAGEELNYRRFFDVDTLAAVRVEDPQVFSETHALLLGLAADGVIDGFRIDHPDGLADPLGYLDKLTTQSNHAWIVIEKILAWDENLPREFSCAGTTGYDALSRISAFLATGDGLAALAAGFSEITQSASGWDEVAVEAKRDAVTGLLVSELDRLTTVAWSACQADVRLRDYSRRGLMEALAEMLIAMQVYRAYVVPGQPANTTAVAQVMGARERAIESAPERADEIDLLARMALGLLGDNEPLREFITRFQQTTGPVLAKGVEDTAAYRWFPLSALCEVGVEPDHAGLEVGQFHEWSQLRSEQWPLSMSCLSTHDTKRSEDARARILALSEYAEQWLEWVRDWQVVVGPLLAPDGSRDQRTEWLILQTLVGVWPIGEERLQAYAIKAVREAKLHTAWVGSDEEYEARVAEYVHAAVSSRRLDELIAVALEGMQRSVATNILAQRTLQLMVPGVPDIYQMCEGINTRLVDPDNRVPVDHDWIRSAAERCRRPADPYRQMNEAKLWLTRQGLRLRRRHAEALSARGSYTPLVLSSEDDTQRERLMGFSRSEAIVVLVSRWARRDTGSPMAVSMPAGNWRNVLTGATVEASGESLDSHQLLDGWPVALWEREPDS